MTKRLAVLKSCAAMAGAAALAACSTAQDRPGRAFVEPGLYNLYDCAQLAAQEKQLEERRQELAGLMARAKQGPGGALISALSYETDYQVKLGELAEVHRMQAERKCRPAPARRSSAVINTAKPAGR